MHKPGGTTPLVFWCLAASLVAVLLFGSTAAMAGGEKGKAPQTEGGSRSRGRSGEVDLSRYGITDDHIDMAIAELEKLKVGNPGSSSRGGRRHSRGRSSGSRHSSSKSGGSRSGSASGLRERKRGTSSRNPERALVLKGSAGQSVDRSRSRSRSRTATRSGSRSGSRKASRSGSRSGSGSRSDSGSRSSGSGSLTTPLLGGSRSAHTKSKKSKRQRSLIEGTSSRLSPSPDQVREMVEITLLDKVFGGFDDNDLGGGGFVGWLARKADNALLDGQLQIGIPRMRATLAAFKAKNRVSQQLAFEFTTAIGFANDILAGVSKDGIWRSQIFEMELKGREERIGAIFEALAEKVAEQGVQLATFSALYKRFSSACFSIVKKQKRLAFGRNQIKLASILFHAALYRELMRATGVSKVKHFHPKMSRREYSAYWLDVMLAELKHRYIAERTEYLRVIEKCTRKKGGSLPEDLERAKELVGSWDALVRVEPEDGKKGN